VPTNNTLHANSLNVSSTDVVSFEIARLNHDVSNVIILIPNSRPKVTSQITLIFFGESYVRELLRLSGRPSLLVSAHDRTWQSRLGSSPTVPPSRFSLVFASSCPPGSSLAYQSGTCNLPSATQRAQSSTVCTCFSQRDVIPICALIIPILTPHSTRLPQSIARGPTPRQLIAILTRSLQRALTLRCKGKQRMPKTASRSHSARRLNAPSWFLRMGGCHESLQGYLEPKLLSHLRQDGVHWH
jgi:hypothetical protein